MSQWLQQKWNIVNFGTVGHIPHWTKKYSEVESEPGTTIQPTQWRHIPSGRGGLVYGLIWHQVTSDLAYFGLTWRGRWVNEWVSECQCVWVTTMIKIISYVVVAFCYRKANILRRWSNILHIFYGNKGLCHGCRSYWFGWKLALLHAAFEQLQY